MRKQKLTFTKVTDREYRERLLQLKEMGISVGSCCQPAEPMRLSLEPIEDDFPRLYALPAGMVAIVLQAKLTVRTEVLITDVALTIPDIDCPLDLSDPMDNQHYPDLIDLLPYNQPEVLNKLLTSGLPLRRRQVQGAIIAEGWPGNWPSPLPLCDDTLVAVKLLLMEEWGDEYLLDFKARVDRCLLRRYERQRQERRERWGSAERTGIFGPAVAPRGDQKRASGEREKRVSPERASSVRDAIGKHNGELHKPN